MYKNTNRTCEINLSNISDKKCLRYGEAYVVPQKYGNLYSCSDALNIGTIFKDLNIPFDENCKKVKKVCKR